MREGPREEGRSQGHKLNITEKIISSLTLLVKYHATIRCTFFESHCTPVCNFIGNVVDKCYTSSYCLTFFIPYFPTTISLLYTN